MEGWLVVHELENPVRGATPSVLTRIRNISIVHNICRRVVGRTAFSRDDGLNRGKELKTCCKQDASPFPPLR
jgi:hypothetical protein